VVQLAGGFRLIDVPSQPVSEVIKKRFLSDGEVLIERTEVGFVSGVGV
jgi:hypothetical protein